MKSQKGKKKYLKIIGNLLTVASIAFVVWRLYNSGFDPSILLQSRMLLVFCVMISTQVLKIMLSCFPWLQLVTILSGEKITFSQAQNTYVRSNMYKYIPGNVFQYVGRNELAIKCGISHVDVACATILDVGIMFLVSLCTAIILMREYALQAIAEHGPTILKIGIAVLAVVCVVILALLPKFKTKIMEYIRRYKGQINKKNGARLLACFGYYAVYNVASCIMIVFASYVMTGGAFNLGLYFQLAGAYTLSFVIGFITPGASGGLGIREAVMLVLSGGMVREDVIVLLSIVLRVVGILGDIAAFALVQLADHICNKKSKGKATQSGK